MGMNERPRPLLGSGSAVSWWRALDEPLFCSVIATLSTRLVVAAKGTN